MTEDHGPAPNDVLEAIAALFTGRPTAAALAHYPTLRIQTDNLHDALGEAVRSTGGTIDRWEARLARNDPTPSAHQSSGMVPDAYRTIAPALARNVHRTADFLLEETRALPPVDVDEVSSTIPGFSDFVKLGASVRAFLDALVQASYQLVTFDALQLNHKFLQSLLSFATVAPASLHANIVSPAVQSALDAYVALSRRERRNSPFTRATNEQFPQRLSVVADETALPEWRRRNLDLLFGFCSDFVHSGYVSILATGDGGPGFVLGGPGDAFTPKAENFAELKLRLLAECAGAYADLFLPALRGAVERMLATDVQPALAMDLDGAAGRIRAVREILHRRLVEPVRRGLIGSDEPASIHCICGGTVDLQPPHHEWDRFCR